MHLLQARVQCLPDIEQTDWFSLNRGLTVVTGRNPKQTRKLLTALETIHPLYPIKEKKPLANHLRYLIRSGYKKRVIPAKKSGVYSIFSAPAKLVHALAPLNPDFYETDRIEIGRRLDYSRWLSFVEISESTRFKEFEREAAPILNNLSAEQQQEYDRIIATWKTNDRIMGEFGKKLAYWWQSLPVKPDKLSLKAEMAERIKRAEQFLQAREVVYKWLPPYILLDTSSQLKEKYPLSNSAELSGPEPVNYLLERITQYRENPEHLQNRLYRYSQQLRKNFQNIPFPQLSFTKDFLLIQPAAGSLPIITHLLCLCLLSRLSCNSPPFFLLHHIDVHHSPEEHDLLQKQLATVADSYQILFAPAKQVNLKLDNRLHLK